MKLSLRRNLPIKVGCILVHYFLQLLIRRIAGHRSMIRRFVLDNCKKSRMWILDFGCGEGIFSDTFYNDAHVKYVGIDHDFYRIDFARSMHRDVHFIRGNETLCFKEKAFDFILINNVLHHMSKNHILILLSELKRTLADDGEIIIIELATRGRQRGFFFRVLTYFEKIINKIAYCDDPFFEQFFMPEFKKNVANEIDHNFMFYVFSKRRSCQERNEPILSREKG